MNRIPAFVLPALLLLGAAGAVPLPQHKPGLWEIISKSGDGQSYESKACLDATTEAAFNAFNLTAGASQCTKSAVSQNGAETLVDSICEISGSRVTSRSVITGQGDHSFHIETTAQWQPPLMGKSQTRSSQDSKWVGACPANMKPGDMVMPGGALTNLGALAVGAQR